MEVVEVWFGKESTKLVVKKHFFSSAISTQYAILLRLDGRFLLI